LQRAARLGPEAGGQVRRGRQPVPGAAVVPAALRVADELGDHHDRLPRAGADGERRAGDVEAGLVRRVGAAEQADRDPPDRLTAGRRHHPH